MKNRATGVLAVLGMGIVILASTMTPAAGQAAANIPRTADKRPDFNGIWQAINTANWNIQDHSAEQGPVLALGAAFSIPAGRGIVVGNEIPYKPEAFPKKVENQLQWTQRDPEVKCYMPGVPRANYMPYPFQIVQTPSVVLMTYEFAGAARTLYINGKEVSPVDSWMGWSNAHWEGDTLVVDVTGFNGEPWLDRAGNYTTETLHVTERYTPITRDAINYEVTLEDPAIYTRPWKMRLPLRRGRSEENWEHACYEGNTDANVARELGFKWFPGVAAPR